MKHNSNDDAKKKLVVISGATGHIGAPISRRVAQLGYAVMLTSSNQVKLEELTAQIKSDGGTVYCKKADLFVEKDRVDLATSTIELGHEILGLVNNAYCGGGGTIQSSSNEDFRRSYEIAVIAPFHLIQLFSPQMLRAVSDGASPSIINVCSMYGHVSPDLSIYNSPEGSNPPFYGAAKAALLQLTRYCAVEFGGRGIRTNSISPGPIPSLAVQEKDPAFIEKLKKKNPMSKIGKPEDIAGVVEFLLSDACTFINGADLKVDGGWTAW